MEMLLVFGRADSKDGCVSVNRQVMRATIADSWPVRGRVQGFLNSTYTASFQARYDMHGHGLSQQPCSDS